MKIIYIITFILTLITNCTYSHLIPRKNLNACDKLDLYVNSIYSEEQFLNYSDVKACYELTPYNETQAIQVIEILKEYFKGFYIFLEKAKEQPNPGFTFRPIDLISELDLIVKNNYSYEYQFIYDVADLIGELRDGHTRLNSGDYNKYTFYQGLSLYSVIKKDGTQQIKVFNDVKDPSNIECQVINIDDRPAIDVITEYAKNNISKSRDLSIRFNYALASLSFGGYGDFSIYGQSFTLRTQLPKTPSISYTLNCNDKISKITREWQVPINDKSNIVWQYKSPYINGNSVGKANLIFDAFIARFYILQDFGVVLISTEVSADSLKYHYLSDLTFGFELLATIGIKKIILDLSNNGGGDVFIAQYIAKLLFPNIQTFPLDIKVNNISIPFIEETSKIKQKVGDIFHYKTFISVNTNNSFNNVTDFIGNNTYNRSDIQLKFTSKAFLNQTAINGGILELSTPPKLPWTEKDIIILTNGICESSCALLTQRLAEINVPTISVGGFPNTQFSFATLSGGASYDTSSIVTSLGQLKNLNSSLISSLSIPSTLTLHFTLAEAYSIKNPSEVLEFSFRPADYQLYYDERSARDPSYLWIQAAKFFEK